MAKPQDFGLGEVRLNSQILAQNSPLVVSTDLVARGTSGERGVVLEMLDVHGKPQKRNQETWKLADGQPQAIEFSMGGLPIGTHQGQLRLVGADGLVGDERPLLHG